MLFLRTNMKWIMLATGILTSTMMAAIFAPHIVTQRAFGAELQGPLAEVLVRSWAVLVTLVGAMLIFAAFHSPHRVLALTVAIISKAALILLILFPGRELAAAATPVIVLDGLMVLIFALCLLSQRGTSHGG